MLPIFDVVLLILLAGFIFYGLFFGLIRVIGGLIGIIVGSILASRYYLLVFDYFGGVFLGYDNLGKVFSFIFAFVLIRKLIVLIVASLNTAFNVISIVPFLTTFNRVGGAIVGFLQGSLILGMILFVASRYAIIDHWFGEFLINSTIVPILIKIASILMPLLPGVLTGLDALI